jgi:hypothetical protein
MYVQTLSCAAVVWAQLCAELAALHVYPENSVLRALRSLGVGVRGAWPMVLLQHWVSILLLCACLNCVMCTLSCTTYEHVAMY